MNNSIYYLKDYGKVKITLKDYMKKNNITRNKLSMLIGSTYNVVDRYYKNKITKPDLDIIARICFVLDCNITDILKYEK